MDIQAFITSAGLSMTCKGADQNPNMIDADPRMNHYACTIKMGKKRLTVPFGMGCGLSREPTLADVLDCLASDAAGIENAWNFEDWCGDYGYDVDSRKAERTYKVCERQHDNLRHLLGDSAFETLLWEVERE